MTEDLKKPIAVKGEPRPSGREEPSLERLKRAAEELKKTGVEELRKENLIANTEGPRQGGADGAGEKTPNLAPQKGEMKITDPPASPCEARRAGTALSDLIQEKMKLEKILQELNNLKSKICQRIELIKTIERREEELNQQLASVRKENDFLDQIKKRFENLKENIK